MEVSRHSSRPRTAGFWGGIAVIIMQFHCQWVSRIPWTFITWRYFHHTVLIYLSISNAIDYVLRPKPFLVVLASLHSAIPSKRILFHSVISSSAQPLHSGMCFFFKFLN